MPITHEGIFFEIVAPEALKRSPLCRICRKNPGIFHFREKELLESGEAPKLKTSSCCATCASAMICSIAERAMKRYIAVGCFDSETPGSN